MRQTQGPHGVICPQSRAKPLISLACRNLAGAWSVLRAPAVATKSPEIGGNIVK
jgi:hypothetical protein